MSAAAGFFEDVQSEFVGELSSKLGVDLTFTLQQRAQKAAEFAEQFDKGMDDATNTKAGARSKNPNKFGNQYEERDVFLRNMNEAINNTDIQYKTTDSIYNEKKQGKKLSESQAQAGQYNDDSTDVVAVQKGKVLKSENRQHKVIKNSAKLAEERYLENNDKITVPPEDYEKHRAFWERKLKGGAQDKTKAKQVLQKLEKGHSSKSSVQLDGTMLGSGVDFFVTDKKSSQKIKQDMIDAKLLAESKAGKLATSGASELFDSVNSGGKTILVYAVMRSLEALKTYFNADNTVSLFETLKQVFNDIKNKFKSVLSGDLSGKILNAVKDFILDFFRDIKQLISKAGKAFTTVVNEVWNYVTGKTDSFAQVVVNIAKVVSTMLVMALGVTIEKWLKTNGVPGYLSLIISAMAVALANVTIFRLIEGASQAVLKIIASRDLAKKRRQEIEALCADVFPLLDEKMSTLGALIETEQTKRTEMFARSFEEITLSMTTANVDDICHSYQSLYTYLGKDMPFTNAASFEAFILDDSISFKL